MLDKKAKTLVKNYDRTIFNSSQYWGGLSQEEKIEQARKALLMPGDPVINLQRLIAECGGAYGFPVE